MKTKKFKFDFNEDAEPVAELRRRRAALSKKYKTVEELAQYYRDRAEEMGYIKKDGYLVLPDSATPATPTQKSKATAKPRKRATTRKTKTVNAK